LVDESVKFCKLDEVQARFLNGNGELSGVIELSFDDIVPSLICLIKEF
jgi:hypothetical protein